MPLLLALICETDPYKFLGSKDYSYKNNALLSLCSFTVYYGSQPKTTITVFVYSWSISCVKSVSVTFMTNVLNRSLRRALTDIGSIVMN